MASHQQGTFVDDVDFKQRSHHINTTEKGFSDASSNEVSLDAKPQHDAETFAKGGQTRYYKPCEQYEGKHRWDPNAEWTEQEEKRIVRRVSNPLA